MRVVDTVEWACVLGGHHIPDDSVEPRMCIRFCVKREHSSTETMQMIQKATAMGNWWLAASSRQCTHSCITSHAELFIGTSNHPGDSAPLQPRFGARWLLAFPKTKITFEREEISDCQWDSGKYNGADSGWENCVRSQTAYFEGDWSVIVLCAIYLTPSSVNVSIFHITWLDTSWTDLSCIYCAHRQEGLTSLKCLYYPK